MDNNDNNLVSKAEFVQFIMNKAKEHSNTND